jgi:excisionase family DNA binding protein
MSSLSVLAGSPDWLTVTAAAQVLGVNRRTVYRWIATKKIEAAELGGLIYVRPNSKDA